MKILEKYTIEINSVPGSVEIQEVDDENVPIYNITMPEFDIGTKSLLDTLTDVMAQRAPLEISEITDPKKIKELKDKIFDDTIKYIQSEFGDLDPRKSNLLAGLLLHRLYGIGQYELLLADDLLEEVVVNNSNTPLVVYHKRYGWLKTTQMMQSEDQIYNLSSQIGRKVNRSISSLNPIMDAHLLTGDRVASTLFPISTLGNTITIRKFARSPWSVTNLIAEKTMSKEIAALLWLAIMYELNVMVVGGTASGKTSLLNSLMTFIPPNQRVISIEDTREIQLASTLHWNWVPLTTRAANPEGQGEVTMLDLMVASLRMRPDRIIVGEVRRKEQAEVMFEAMHTGHSVYTTMHADTVQQIRRRLMEEPFAIPKAEVEALQLVVVQYRDRRKNVRRTLEVAEILVSGKTDLDINYLYRWRPRKDVFEKADTSVRLYEDLNLHTGMTIEEIESDLRDKEMILQWLVDYKFTDNDKLGKIFKIYYKTSQVVIEAARNNLDPESLLKND